jgi:hypothetical protein
VSTVRNADLILVLDQHSIVARGTHEMLLATSALYGEIVASQLQDDVPLAMPGDGHTPEQPPPPETASARKEAQL